MVLHARSLAQCNNKVDLDRLVANSESWTVLGRSNKQTKKSQNGKIHGRMVVVSSAFVVCLFLLVSTTFVTATTATTTAATATALFDSDWELLETYPHDPTSFTQGLEVHPSSVILRNGEPNDNGASCPSGSANEEGTTCARERLLLVESTGMHGDSLLRIWDPLQEMAIVKETKLGEKFFGEGSTVFVDEDGTKKIAVLTWQEQTILVYNANSLELIETIERWPSPTTTKEGWGIAFDPSNKVFCVSDGSEYLHFWNTRFEEAKPRVRVRIEELVALQNDGSKAVMIPRDDDKGGTPVRHLNELEWDASTNTLLANVWIHRVVLRIDPSTGVVTRVYDFSKLDPKQQQQQAESASNDDVFNGIAILPNTDGKEWIVTGKYWSTLYRIRINEGRNEGMNE